MIIYFSNQTLIKWNKVLWAYIIICFAYFLLCNLAFWVAKLYYNSSLKEILSNLHNFRKRGKWNIYKISVIWNPTIYKNNNTFCTSKIYHRNAMVELIIWKSLILEHIKIVLFKQIIILRWRKVIWQNVTTKYFKN